ncbi:MAG: N-acyl-D-amino-acid deacylase family protein [bacterium]|jgi:N-acyl-D-amino-acid deacylase
MFDVLIKNGRIVDGTGNPWFKADIGVKDGKIAAISHQLDSEAQTVIDAKGLVVSPGFIDMHTHSDLRVFKHPDEDAKLMQGITSALIGQDGLSVAPIDDANKKPMMQRISGLLGTYLAEWHWNTMAEYLDAIDAVKPATNSMMLVPHGAIRAMALGWENRPATAEELEKMKGFLAQAMEEGGFGFSTGLIYPPGMYADHNELVELCKVAASYGGFFVVHMRNEGDYLEESIKEVTDICLEAGCPLHISHLKAGGRPNWGKSKVALEMIEQARAKGLEVTFDQYPYIAGSTMLDAVIPPRFHTGGTKQLLESLKDPAVREEIRKVQDNVTPERWENWIAACGWDGIMINAVESDKNRFAEGKRVTELAAELNKTPLDVVCDLLIEENDAVTMTVFYGSEDDVKEIMKSDYMTACSDGIVGGKPHPRVYGTMPRILGKYVREEKVISLHDAIKKMTSMPAQRLGLQDRGILREGSVADITIFDPDTIIDTNSFAEPSQFPVGIIHVLVSGQLAVQDGKITGVRAGRALRHGH